jgi:Zn-dependent peptidase ImmA (M78 family)/transcriptional regulator with XRE-family HTH domain
MKGINVNMIVLAREARGMNQGALAERVSMSATNLSKIERGEIGISEEHIRDIAEATDLPVHFFMQEGNIVPQNLAYRKRLNVPQTVINTIMGRANIIRRHVQLVNGALQVAPPALPCWTVSESVTPQIIAGKLRQRWEINDIKSTPLLKTIEKQGIMVFSFDFETERVDSFTMLTDNKQPIIFLNKRLEGDRMRFSLAYELGQLLMHTFCDLTAEQDIGHEANLFAAELLMPEKEIRKDMKEGITVTLLAALKKKWKVSMIALLYRADDLGVITANQKRYLLLQFNQLNIRRTEPEQLRIAAEMPALLRFRIGEFMKKGKLSISDVSALLCIQVDEFMELYG